MGLKKCPICELNYTDEQNEMCDICLRARKGTEAPEEYTMCIVCGENHAISDLGLCAMCVQGREVMTSGEVTAEMTEAGLDPVSNAVMDNGLDDMEIPIENESDIPESEYRQIAIALDIDEEDALQDDDDEDGSQSEYGIENTGMPNAADSKSPSQH